MKGWTISYSIYYMFNNEKIIMRIYIQYHGRRLLSLSYSLPPSVEQMESFSSWFH